MGGITTGVDGPIGEEEEGVFPSTGSGGDVTLVITMPMEGHDL